MTIDKIRQDTILVTLNDKDMERYELDFGSAYERARAGLMRLMRRVGDECGLSHDDKRYLIEALPGGDSCLLIISVYAVKRRRLYRVKKERKLECCRFSSADGLLDYLDRSPELSFEVYRYKNGYVLFPELPLSPRLRGELNEFGCVIEMKTVEAARVREYGAQVLSRAGRQNRSLKLMRMAAR